MYYAIAIFFLFIGLLVLTIENRHFKAAYSFSFISGIGYLLYKETIFEGINFTISNRSFDIWDVLFTFGIGIGLPIALQAVLWFIYRNKPKEQIGLDYDLITGVLSFLHFGISIFIGHLIAGSWGVFAIAFGHLIIYTFGRFILKHVSLIGTERNNSLAILALVPLIAGNAGFDSINIFDGNVMLGFFSGAVFVLMNLVAGLLSEKLSTRYLVLFLSLLLFVGGGLGYLIKENFGGLETLVAGIYSIVVVVAFARSFGNPLRLINFDFNSLLFLFTGLLLLLAPYISKPDLTEGKVVTQGTEIELDKKVISTENGQTINVIKIEKNAVGHWKSFQEASNLTFQILSQGKPTDGRFDQFSGNIFIDSILSNSKIEFTVDVASINTFSKQRDEHLIAQDYFDVAQFPKAVFKSDSIYFSDTCYVAMGNFTMKEKSNQIPIYFNLDKKATTDENKEFTVWKGRFEIDRTQFNMEHKKGIDDFVQLHFVVEARQ